MNLTYINEKLSGVIRELTTGNDSIVERLRKAGRPHLALLPEDSFPENVRAIWLEVSTAFKEDMRHQNLTAEKATDLVNKILQVKDEVNIAISTRRR